MYIWVRFKPKETNKEKQQHVIHEDKEDDDDHVDANVGDDTGLLGQEQQVSEENRRKSVPPSGSPDQKKDYYATMLRDREVFIRSQPPMYKMIYYMWTAPITKFWTFHMFYILFLALFSWAVLYPSCGSMKLDAAVCFWTSLIVIEYIRRTYILYRKYTSIPLVFKCMEILLIIGFIVVYASSSIWGVKLYSPYTRKVMLCFALLYFYYRLIAIYLPISPTLGPLLHRLKLMVGMKSI